MTETERTAFVTDGGSISVAVGDDKALLHPRAFRTGSCGWHGTWKCTIAGRRCQVNVLVTVIGSKAAGNGEQTITRPPDEPETPQGLFEAEKGQRPGKRSRKRS